MMLSATSMIDIVLIERTERAMFSAASLLPAAATLTALPDLEIASIASISDGTANIQAMKYENMPNTIAAEAVTIAATATPLPDLKSTGAAYSAGVLAGLYLLLAGGAGGVCGIWGVYGAAGRAQGEGGGTAPVGEPGSGAAV